MTTVRTINRSFAGGEIAPELYGRMDLDKFQTGLAECENFIVLPHGPAQNRPGFAYVNTVASANFPVRLIPFSFSATETVVLEFGHYYVRFHTNGGTVLEPSKTITAISGSTVTIPSHGYSPWDWVYIGGRFFPILTTTTNTITLIDLFGEYAQPSGTTAARVYQIGSPYGQNDIFDINYVQSSDVLTLVHPDYKPRELRRMGNTDWELKVISFAQALQPPDNLTQTTVKESGTTGARTYDYVVTSVNITGVEESEASDPITSGETNLGQSTNRVTINWDAAAGADRYYVYKFQGGVFGYIGQTTDTSFVDTNIAPDTLRTPPEPALPFEAAGDYPSAVTYFDQRRVFAATDNNPQSVWMTKVASETNMTTSLPVQDSDAISFRIAARQQNRIRHMVPMSDLLLLTAGGEWRVFTGSGEPLTAANMVARPQSYVGANNVQPVVTSLSAIYVSAQGSRFRELVYNAEGVGSYQTEDLSVLTPHMVNGYEIKDLAFSRGPTPLVWAVRDDGALLCLTYLPEQKVRAWHRHTTTNGHFESICCVAEGNEDVLYAVVRRTINGAPRRYIERLQPQTLGEHEDAFFVDCGDTYDGPPTQIISGLWHLEGQTVNILGDGAVFPPQVVEDGQIELEHPVSKAHIGLPIVASLKTLPVTIEAAPTFGPSYVKNVSRAFLQVHRSGGIFVGPDFDNLVEHKQRTDEPWGSPPRLISGEVEVPLTTTWSKDGAVCVRQTAPLPLTVQSIALEVSVGG
jgi:hypothetical protein